MENIQSLGPWKEDVISLDSTLWLAWKGILAQETKRTTPYVKDLHPLAHDKGVELAVTPQQPVLSAPELARMVYTDWVAPHEVTMRYNNVTLGTTPDTEQMVIQKMRAERIEDKKAREERRLRQEREMLEKQSAEAQKALGVGGGGGGATAAPTAVKVESGL